MTGESFAQFLFSEDCMVWRQAVYDGAEIATDRVWELVKLLQGGYTLNSKIDRYDTVAHLLTRALRGQVGPARAFHPAGGRRMADGANWKGFINVSLTREDKQAIKELAGDLDALITWAGELITEGYMLSVKHDSHSNGPMVSLKCVDPENVDYGWAVTSRHSDVFVAWATAYYKHTVLLADGWTAYAPKVDEDGTWD